MTPVDRGHLDRCVELAQEALDDGDEPFGSVLVGPDGSVLFEDRNRVKDGDRTRHPEFEIARWAAAHVPPSERASCIVYTSGGHCAMCSAAHAWVGLSKIVYATSTTQLSSWLSEWKLPAGPLAALSINDVAPGVPVAGPCDELVPVVKSLHARLHGLT
ncbi:MAG: nucleoside deaminase [Cumulibacter sp.]